MMLAQKLLDRLEGVMQTAEGHWRARCPGHGSKGRTLAVSEKDDRVLVKCFAECPVDHILGTVGLDLQDLFPEPRPDDPNGIYSDQFPRPRIPPQDILNCLCEEIEVINYYMDGLAKGQKFFVEDVERFQMAYARVKAAREYVSA